MMARQGLAYFPGIQQIKSANYTRGHGIEPGMITIEIAPQNNFPSNTGDVTFSFVDFELVVRDCLLDYASFRLNQEGLIIGLTILDRRWKWREGKGRIGGFYNLRNHDGSIKPETALTGADLVELCLINLGETNYDLGDTPTNTNPLTEWSAKPTTEALDMLLTELGCRLMLTKDNRIRIRRQGLGGPLPNGGIIDNSFNLNPPQPPDQIQAIAAPSRYQVDLMLEAVGQEKTGQVVNIDNLSYKPNGGWGPADGGFYNCIPDQTERGLALQCIYRWYRVAIPPGGLIIPGYRGQILTLGGPIKSVPIKNLQQILPLLPFQNVKENIRQEDGTQVPTNKPAYVHGLWTSEHEDGEFLLSLQLSDPLAAAKLTPDVDAPGARYLRGMSIDAEFGIVKFSEQVYIYNPNGNGNPYYGGGNNSFTAPAQLVLRCVVNVRDPDTREPDRYFLYRNYANNGTPPKCLVHEETILSAIPTYSLSTYELISVAYSYDDPDTWLNTKAELNYFLDAAELEYEYEAPITIRYEGLIDGELDGAIQQITYEISEEGAFTTMCRNTEQVHRVLPYKERQMIRKLRDFQEAELLKNRPSIQKRPSKAVNNPIVANEVNVPGGGYF